ncbi:hypothetical protein SAMN06265370_1246 [Puniceibacterium sediminis]|uniref:Uncharacterized protein n=1 Tax=Puniceibacterium sediminis TaxID=1608407 RepID=A0A238Z550_9RHOB|nr:hypothetical protein SAMN06265370_1246 [Puniceibacterium sediminis]
MGAFRLLAAAACRTLEAMRGKIGIDVRKDLLNEEGPDLPSKPRFMIDLSLPGTDVRSRCAQG